MFEEEFENMSPEEQESFLDCQEEMLEAVALGNGDYYIGDNEAIIFED